MKCSKLQKQIRQKLKRFSELFDVQIAGFYYDEKYFGNFTFEMICEDETFTFERDRGFVASNYACADDSYYISGKPDEPDSLLEEMTRICVEKRGENSARYSFDQCRKMLSNANYLVRAYATFFFPSDDSGKTVKEQVDLLESFLKVEQDSWTRLFFARQLLRLGQEKYFTYFVSAVNSPEMRLRRIMILFIPDIIDFLSDENRHILQTFLDQRELLEGGVFGKEFIWGMIIETIKKYFELKF